MLENIKKDINKTHYKQLIGFILGLALFVFLLLNPISNVYEFQKYDFLNNTEKLELTRSLNIVFALLILMVVWWVTEAIPIYVTALLPAIILPVFQVTGLMDGVIYNFNFLNSLKGYAHPVIGMFLGAFLIAVAFQKYAVDKRATIFLLTYKKIYQNPRSTLIALMYTSAILSMWISNTATVAILLPIGIGIIRSTKSENHNFSTSLMLGIAWSASVGGIATIVGTPPNGIAISLLNQHNLKALDFVEWMKIGIPFTIFFIPIIWFVLLKRFPIAKETMIDENYFLTIKNNLGKIKKGEILVLSVFLFIVSLWISNPFWKNIFPENIFQKLSWVDEYMIGLIGGILMFLIPLNLKKLEFILDWKDTKNVDWGTLILFGGGLTLSDAMFKTGLAPWMANSFLSLFGSPPLLIMLMFIVIFIVILTEVTSNTAVTAMIIPVLIAISVSSGYDATTLSVTAAISASLAFMLPVATPPNALVYSSGYVKLSQMINVGLILEIIGWLFTIFILFIFGDIIFNVLKF